MPVPEEPPEQHVSERPLISAGPLKPPSGEEKYDPLPDLLKIMKES